MKNKEKEQANVDKIKAELAAKQKKRNNLEKRLNPTKTTHELIEQEAELRRQNEEDRALINGENTSPSEKAAAEDRVAER